MVSRPDNSLGIAAKTRESNEYIAKAQLRARSQMFFAGLSFAVLSFIGSHPIISDSLILKLFETFSLLFLFCAGVILLLRLERYAGPLKHMNSASKREEYIKSPGCALCKQVMIFLFLEEKSYWPCFIGGMALMLVDRAAFLFLNSI